MMRVIRCLLGKSRRANAAKAEMEEHRESQAIAMMAVDLKVNALREGAQRVVREGIKTEEAASLLMSRLKEDLT